MSRRLPSIAGNLLLACASMGLALGCGELWLRRVAPELVAPPIDRAFLSDFYRANSDGVFTWPPDRPIRYAKTHGDRVEFDVLFRSNDLGLVDDENYAVPTDRSRRVALVGDSFTAGYHGGRPWVPELRERMAGEDIAFYNLGIGGAGFIQFENLLGSVFEKIRFTDVVLLVISDDLLRPPWYLDVEHDRARFCPESWAPWLCRLKPPYFHRIGLESDPAEWVSRRFDPPSVLNRSALVSLFMHVLRASERTEEERRARIAANERALSSIVRAYGSRRVFVVHLPMRNEVVRGSYDAYARDLPGFVGELGVDYFPALGGCHWNAGMFFEHDTHPNARGYTRVISCVEGYLRERVMRRSGSVSPRPGESRE
jgi:lysophospholipase L1-like esterase